mgnify:CR=1 FL=1
MVYAGLETQKNAEAQMKMFSKFVLGVCAMLVVVGTAMGDSAIPYDDDFEAYSVGDSIVGINGWMGATNTLATVTNMSYTFTDTSQPLTNSFHTKVALLNTEGEVLSNNFERIDVTNVWIDTMFKVALSDSQPTSITNQTDVQAAFYFDTNANLVVYHSKFYGVGSYSNRFTVVTNVTANTAGWSRITVTMDYLSDQFLGLFPEEKYYKVQIDSVDAVSGEAFQTPELDTNAMNGSWFLCPNRGAADNTNFFFSSVHLSGTGMFDDFVVSDQQPFFGAGAVQISTLITPSDGRGGTVTPMGPILLPSGGTTNFEFVTSNYWSLASVSTNDSLLAGPPANVTLSNVTENITLEAVFAANTVSNVPIWWLVQNGGDTNNPTNDSDGDTVPDDVEWAGSTDAGNSNSYFAVMTIGNTDGTNYIEWITDAIDPALGPYKIEKSTNLVDGWFDASPATHPREMGTNTWWEDAPALTNMPEFFRIVTTNVSI